MAHFSRRMLFGITAATVLRGVVPAPFIAPAFAQGPPTAKLKRIRMVTMGTPNLESAVAWYQQWLDYKPGRRGKIAEGMAASWGAPGMAGRDFVLMQPSSGEDVSIRLASIDPVPAFNQLATLGWNATELVVADLDASFKKFQAAPAQILEAPDGIGLGAIKAFQVKGPSGEVLYLTSNTGDRLKSNHPEPTSPIGRPFIMIVGGRDLKELKKFYLETFDLGDQGDLQLKVRVLNNYFKLPEDTKTDIAVVVLSERGNKIELDQMPKATVERPKTMGQLPPATAMVSFSVADLDTIAAPLLDAPRNNYGKVRSACCKGPAGELIELVEDRK
jgi:catechol 2,3-dioxygenase-like lactoylglutathione lyase family enzyme